MSKANFLGFILLFTLLALIVYLLYFFIGWLKGLNPSVGAALVTASLGLVGLWYAQWQSKGRDIAESHRASKIEAYNLFFEIVESFQNEEIDSGKLPEELKKKFTKLTRGLVLWASPEVIKAYLNFRAIANDNSENKILYAMDEVYQAIRKDLSNSNSTLSKGDLIRLNLKNPNELR
ncbi:hypothetical protein Q5M49_17585 [Acinetobacter nosocomialis]|uniref:hypothetical protein n=1 Tax=Acinetobacter nosocomialis TaxID=106654 RepID=UPI00270BE854|nr:hypothetical protein [Acinetobacter nosocomialis]MDO7195474.1 hypothetical protein [Acinetobacter nosocomialis]